jgi:dihydropteroate synthase
LADAAKRAEAAGVAPDKIVLDPGIGFGKTFDHNLKLINRLRQLADLGRPLLVGPSRKAFLGAVLGGAPPKDRDTATAAVAALCVYNGADIIRAHNAAAARDAAAAALAVVRERV